MPRNIIFGIAAAYLVVLLETSFFAHIVPLWFSGALFAFLIAFFVLRESKTTTDSILFAIASGFLFDVFSGGLLPLWSVFFGIFGMAIKYATVHYVRIPSF